MVGAAGAALPLTIFRPGSAPAALAGFSTPLPLLPKAKPVAANRYLITARAGQQKFHPSFGAARFFGYDDNSNRGVRTPGYVIEAQKGTATTIDFVNNLPATHLFDS